MIAATVTIRDYEERDHGGLIALARELQGHELQFETRMKPVAAMDKSYVAHLIAQVREARGRLLVADAGTELLGYCTLLTYSDSSGEFDEVLYGYSYISDLVVAEKARGTGIGGLLVSACEGAARVAGQKWLRLSVMAANGHARQFYEAHGFREHLILLEKTL